MINLMYLMDDLMLGGNTGVVNLAKYLDKSIYKLTVCCLFGGGPLQEDLESINIKIEILDFANKKLPSFIKLISLLKTNKIDILHTYAFFPNTIGRIAGLFAAVPIMISWEGSFDRRTNLHCFLDKILSCFTKKIIAISEWVKESIVLHVKIPASKVAVIYYGVDLDEYKSSLSHNFYADKNGYDKGPTIGMIANFKLDKAIPIFIKSAKIVLEKYPAAKFVLVGDGAGKEGKEVKKEIENLVKTLDLSKNVIFMGQRKDVPQILSTFDIEVITSLSEGLCMALIEAMALAKPVVATAVGGIPEVVVDKITGLLVPTNDEKALAEAIFKILSDKKLAYKMGLEGRKRVEEIFDARKVVKKLEAIYENLLKRQ